MHGEIPANVPSRPPYKQPLSMLTNAGVKLQIRHINPV